MKKNSIYLLVILLFSFTLSSCDDDNVLAELLLYGNDNPVLIDIELSMNRVGGWYLLDGSQLYGLDVVVINTNNFPISDITIHMESVSPSFSVLGFSSEDDPYIEYLEPDYSVIPDFHWWSTGMDGISQVYIGNFYVSLENYVTAGQTYTVSFVVNFSTEANSVYSFNISRTFTTVGTLYPLPI